MNARRLVIASIALRVSIAADAVAEPARVADTSSRRRDTIVQRSAFAQWTEHPSVAAGTLAELADCGNHGVGTFANRNSGWILLDGTFYAFGPEGRVFSPSLEEAVSFGLVTWFETDDLYTVSKLERPVMVRALSWKSPERGQPAAVRIRGRFRFIELSSAFRPLSGTLPEPGDRPPLRLENVEGLMIGFRAPPALAGTMPAPYVFCFLSGDRSIGGAVADFELAVGRIEIDRASKLELDLPLLPTADASP